MAKQLKLLVACEFSGIVRNAFAARDWDAWSCDILPTERPGQHHQGDVLEIVNDDWDLLIAHPPCTDLAVSGARHFNKKRDEQVKSLEFAHKLWTSVVPRIALENPVSILSSYIGRPTQIIQPWWFGHGITKSTCLWLKGLPKLWPTDTVPVVTKNSIRDQSLGPRNKVLQPWMVKGYNPTTEHYDDRRKERSRTYKGIAEAMAQQWTEWILRYPTGIVNPFRPRSSKAK